MAPVTASAPLALDTAGSPRSRVVRRMLKQLRRPRVFLSVAMLLVVVLAALLVPLYPVDPMKQDLSATLKPPMFVSKGVTHVAGTDQLGRDLFARLLLGARVSLSLGVISLAIALFVGVTLGLLAGFFGGVVDAVINAVTETLMSLPFVLLAIAIIAAVGASLTVVILTLGLTGWVSFARLTRGRVMELREEEYVVAAHALGAGSTRVMLRHLLPNLVPLLLVEGTLKLGGLILAEAGLSFLGLGIQPPTPSWGGILAESQVFVTVAWWLPTFPGLALLGTLLSVNLLGDSLRDVLAPEG